MRYEFARLGFQFWRFNSFPVLSLGKEAGVYILILQMQQVDHLRKLAQKPGTGGRSIIITKQLLVPDSAFGTLQDVVLQENL